MQRPLSSTFNQKLRRIRKITVKFHEISFVGSLAVTRGKETDVKHIGPFLKFWLGMQLLKLVLILQMTDHATVKMDRR